MNKNKSTAIITIMTSTILAIIVVTTTLTAIYGPVFSSTIRASAQQPSVMTNSTTPSLLNASNQTAGSNATSNVGARVAVGGGDLQVQNYRFSPQNVTIGVGQNVTWYSPTPVNELHTVTFVLNQTINSGIVLPFSVSNTTQFKLMPPYNLGEPLTRAGPNGTTVIVALNKDTWNPAVLKSGTSNVTILNGTSNGNYFYAMTGNEQAINSGIIQQRQPTNSTAAGAPGSANTTASMTSGTSNAATGTNATNPAMQPSSTSSGQPSGPPYPTVSSFTIRFDKAGTYDYFCAFHPWMTGRVTVK